MKCHSGQYGMAGMKGGCRTGLRHGGLNRIVWLAAGLCWIAGFGLSGGPAMAQVPQQPVSDQIMFHGGPLQAYYTYLVNLDRNRMESVPAAVAEFERVFFQAASATCDSAFLMLEDFAMTVLDQAAFNDLLLKAAESARSAREKQAAEKYVALLEKNYFMVRQTPDAVSVRPDFDAIRERLGRYLSDGTRTFFVLVAMEEEEPCAKGDSLAVSWQTLAKRLVGWEHFLEQYDGTLYASEARQRRDAYLEMLIFGLTETPVCDGSGRLSAEVEAVYRMLLKHPVGHTGQVLADYWKVLSENGFRCAEPAVLFFTY